MGAKKKIVKLRGQGAVRSVDVADGTGLTKALLHIPQRSRVARTKVTQSPSTPRSGSKNPEAHRNLTAHALNEAVTHCVILEPAADTEYVDRLCVQGVGDSSAFTPILQLDSDSTARKISAHTMKNTDEQRPALDSADTPGSTGNPGTTSVSSTMLSAEMIALSNSCIGVRELRVLVEGYTRISFTNAKRSI